MAKKQTNVFDFSKFAESFDASKMTEEFTKAFSQFKIPSVDMDGIIASQKKNLDALTVANETAVSGLQAVATRQAELMKQAVESSTAAAEDLMKSASPQEAATKQVDLVKATYEKTLADMAEIADMMTKSTSEASAAINKRISEGLDEVKGLAATA